MGKYGGENYQQLQAIYCSFCAQVTGEMPPLTLCMVAEVGVTLHPLMPLFMEAGAWVGVLHSLMPFARGFE